MAGTIALWVAALVKNHAMKALYILMIVSCLGCNKDEVEPSVDYSGVYKGDYTVSTSSLLKDGTPYPQESTSSNMLIQVSQQPSKNVLKITDAFEHEVLVRLDGNQFKALDYTDPLQHSINGSFTDSLITYQGSARQDDKLVTIQVTAKRFTF